MGEAYLNQDDARMRLGGSICRWKGEPVFVNIDGEDGRSDSVVISFFDGSGRREKRVRYTSKYFDYGAFPLGYMNTQEVGCIYLSRMPMRRQKQGLTYNNTIFLQSGMNAVRNYFPSVELYKCIMGDYPSFHAAQKSMIDGIVGVAVDREIGFNKQDDNVYGMYYRGRLVGHYMPSNRTTTLLDTPSTSIVVQALSRIGLDDLI